MGLSAPKNRTKLSADPNNTAWAKSTTRFGHKILSAQGWKPGDYLGAQNASHAEHYTAANASHIRVMLREDNLGLGAQIGKGSAETFGLSMFSGLLGRLNGKSDAELEAQQQARRDAEIKIQHEQKYGFLNFVSGGFLIGDKIEEKSSLWSGLPTTKDANQKESGIKPESAISEAGATDVLTTTSTITETMSESAETDFEKKAKSKKQKIQPGETEKNARSAGAKSESTQSKAERRAQKEERRRQKEERRQRRALKKASKLAKEKDAPCTTAKPMVSSGTVNNGSRHATRQRYIQQKRMASMDPRALKEIFMLQAK